MGQDQILTVLVPLTIRKRGGRKQVIAPDGTTPWVSPEHRIDSAMVKALARAFRWRKLLETGVYGTVAELAAAEKINEAYVGRVLRLTLLAPDVVEAILAGRPPEGMTLAGMMEAVPVIWAKHPRGSQRYFIPMTVLETI